MRKKIFPVILCLVAATVSPPIAGAQTGGKVEIKVSLDAGAVSPCSATAEPDALLAQAEVKAEVTQNLTTLDSKNPAVSALTFAVQLKGAAAETPLSSGTGAKVPLSGGPSKLSDYDGATIIVKRNGKKFCDALIKVEAPQPSCEEFVRDATDDAIEYIQKGSLVPLDSQGRPTLVTRAGVVRRSIVVPILPDGKRYGELPADITERDEIQLVVVAPSNATVEWEVPSADGKDTQKTTCTAPPLWRNLITSGAEVGQGKAATEKKAAPPMPQWHAPFGHGCQDALNYVVRITLPECKNAAIVAKDSIPTAKVYDFLLGAGFGYDFGSPTKYSSQTKISGSTTQQVLVRTRDDTGLKPIVTLSYFPFGANPTKWECRNWLSPFIGLDPTRIDKGAIVGVNFQPFGIAFSILTGVSVYQSEKVNSPVGLKPGDVIPSGTQLSTRNVFNSDGLGFFFGANFTTESLKLFLSKGAEAFGATK